MLQSAIHTILIFLAVTYAKGQILDVCEDSSGLFDIGNGTNRSCDVAVSDPDYCDKDVFRLNCPKTCNACCRDNPGYFNIANGRNLRCIRFKHRPDLCNFEEFRTNCPQSCGRCPCRDHTGKFTTKVGRRRSCEYIQDNPIKCRNEMFSSKCPVTCNKCEEREYEAICKIDAKITFPYMEKAHYDGYYNDYIEVDKNDTDETCSFESPSTSWGCTYKDDALIKQSNPKSNDYLQSESIHIESGASSTFKFSLQRYFNYQREKYYDEARRLAGTMSIKTTGNKRRTFSLPKNNNRDTHINGEVNPEYKGHIIVTVDCDENCECTMSKQVL